MNQEMLNQQKRVTTEVSLDGFIVRETLATHLVPGNNRKGIFSLAELKSIQKKRRGATVRLYNRHF